MPRRAGAALRTTSVGATVLADAVRFALTFAVNAGPCAVLLFAPLQATVVVMVTTFDPARLRAVSIASFRALVYAAALALVVHTLRPLLADTTAAATAVVTALPVGAVGHAETRAAFAVTEAGAGSDLAPLQTPIAIELATLLDTVVGTGHSSGRAAFFLAGASTKPLFAVDPARADAAATTAAITATLLAFAGGLAASCILLWLR